MTRRRPQLAGYQGVCLDLPAAANTDGTAVTIYSCNGTNGHQWAEMSDGTVRAARKCLDVTATGTANGTQVQLYDCNGSNAQQWTRNGLELVNTGSHRCLDATGNSSADGTRLEIWDCANSGNQQWALPS